MRVEGQQRQSTRVLSNLAYRQSSGGTPELASTTAQQDQPARRLCGQASLAMLRRTWYRRLARTNLFIVEARQRVAMQKALVSSLDAEGRGTRCALARLRRSEVMLQLLEDDREVILEKVRKSPLPALRHIRGYSILKF